MRVLLAARILLVLLAAAVFLFSEWSPSESDVVEWERTDSLPQYTSCDGYPRRRLPSISRMHAENLKLEEQIRTLRRLEAGVKAYRSGRLDEADAIFSSVTAARWPVAPYVHINRGVILDRRGHPEAAVLEYERALATLAPTDSLRARCYHAIGVALERQGKRREAERAFEMARREVARAFERGEL